MMNPIKIADTEVPIYPILANRYSTRAYSDRAVEQEKITKMMEAARWAPSAGNSQPWRYIVGHKGTENWQKIYENLMPGNQLWCQHVPVLIVVCGLNVNDKGDKMAFSLYDTGQSVAHLTIQATADGLYCHQMAGIHPNQLHDIFELPTNISVYTVIAVGYLGNADHLNDDFKARELERRTRKPLESLFVDKTQK